MRRIRRCRRNPHAWTVEVKKRGQVSTITYPYFPMNAVGWHGDLAPVKLNVRDIRPVVAHRYHLPPSVHTTFLSDRFVVCTFAPRPFETDPGAIKVPFFHNRLRFRRSAVLPCRRLLQPRQHQGRNDDVPSVRLHAWAASEGPTKMLKQDKPMTDEYAVMIDTRDPLDVARRPRRWRTLTTSTAGSPSKLALAAAMLAPTSPEGALGSHLTYQNSMKPVSPPRMEKFRMRAVLSTTIAALLLAACGGRTCTDHSSCHTRPGACCDACGGPAPLAVPEGRIGTMNLTCGGRSFRVAFLDTHAAIVSADGATTIELPKLEPSATSEPGVTTYTDGKQTFARSGGGRLATVIRYAVGLDGFSGLCDRTELTQDSVCSAPNLTA